MIKIDRDLRDRLNKVQEEVFQLGKDFELEYNRGMQRRQSPVVDDARDEANNEAAVLCFQAYDIFRRAGEALNVIK